MERSLILVAVGLPRAVAAGRAFVWYEQAMRMFKRAPLVWCALGFVTLATEIGLQFIPAIGIAASWVIVPVVECGLLIGAAALDHGRPLTLRYALIAFGVGPAALAAIVGSGLIVFAAEAFTAYSLAGLNLLTSDLTGGDLTGAQLVAVLSTGTLVSLPLAFVPFAVVFAGTSFIGAFATSVQGFALNVLPLFVFGALAMVLVGVGVVMTFGVGLIAVLPLLSAASYAAWKDIYGVTLPAGAAGGTSV